MADRHGQAEAVAELFLQLLLPEAGATAIAPGIGQDQQVLGRAMQRLADRRPPTGDHVHRELGRIGRGADIDGPLIVADVIDTVRHCRPRASDGKSCTLTAAASRLQAAPAFLKSPISSFFLVSTLMVGHPAAANAACWVAIYSNWALRSGCRALASSFLAFTCRA